MKRLAAQHTYSRGFTLIELLVVITILTIIVGAGIASYQQFNEKQIVISATQNVISAIRKIQKKTSVGDKPTACGTEILRGYQYRGSSNGYVLYAQCNADINIESQSFSDVAMNPPAYTVTISDLGRNTTANGPTLELRTSLYHNVIRISQTGEISEDGVQAN